MSAIDIINRLPSLWLAILYTGTPVIFLIINFYNLTSIKKNIIKAGKHLYYFPKKEISRRSKTICIIMLTLSVVACILNKTIGFVFVLYSFSNLTWLISESIYSGKNGIYENGVINHELIEWGSIYSWKILGEKLELLNKDGIKNEYVIDKNMEEIRKTLERNGIKKE